MWLNLILSISYLNLSPNNVVKMASWCSSLIPCLVSQSSSSSTFKKLKDRWQELVNIINAKYLNMLGVDKQKLAVHELVFHLLCLVYEQEDVVEDLLLAYLLNPSLIEHYIPQISAYVLSVISEHSKRLLTDFILIKCQQNLRFAHLSYWHLNSYQQINSEASHRLKAVMLKIASAA
jgi:hypothetical protein